MRKKKFLSARGLNAESFQKKSSSLSCDGQQSDAAEKHRGS